MLTYQPGDSFDVFCPNRANEVEEMLHRLGLQHQRNHRVHISLRKDTKKKGKVPWLNLYAPSVFLKRSLKYIYFLNILMPVTFLYFN